MARKRESYTAVVQKQQAQMPAYKRKPLACS